MPSATMTVTFTVERPWPNFVITGGPFTLACLRVRVSAAAMSQAWRYLFMALRLGRRVWYYYNMPEAQLKAEGEYCIVRRVLGPKPD